MSMQLNNYGEDIPSSKVTYDIDSDIRYLGQEFPKEASRYPFSGDFVGSIVE